MDRAADAGAPGGGDDQPVCSGALTFGRSQARHFVVIDIKTGEYEVSEGPIRSTDATQRLLERCPEAKRRIGSPTAHRIGGRFLPAGEVTCEEL